MMPLNEGLAGARVQRALLTVYQKFEHVIILVLTALIAVVVVLAVWNLALKILFGIVLSSTLDPSDYAAFQAVFGMIFTVIIALEFKRSLLIVVERGYGVVHVRSVVLIALLAIVRKLLILDFARTDAQELFGLAALILALGVVHWLVRDQDLREAVNEGPLDPTSPAASSRT
jgi:uncharacterized membrane protein (DUF373 family)